MTSRDPTLNPEQQRIVDRISGAVLILAPVGTGKTLVLAERAANAVKSGIPPAGILCLTFTNRAAREMCARLAMRSPEAAREATIMTFHALCAHMLRHEARRIGLPADFVVYDEVDSQEVLREICGPMKDPEALALLETVSTCKTNASGERLSCDCAPEKLYGALAPEIARGACRYQRFLRERHALDFADLVFFTRAMLRERADIRERWEKRFAFLQVDEVQDTHMSEYAIVRVLARRSGNLALIGDIDQTIYGWRGSEPENVIALFEKEFKPARHDLSVNYRATRTLLGAADCVARLFRTRWTKIVASGSCAAGDPVRVHRALNEGEEGKWIGRRIRALGDGDRSFAYNRVAVLTRTNARSVAVSSALEASGIPFVTVEQYEFFRRQEVKDALACLRLLVNPYDAASMRRVLLRPARGVGEMTFSAIAREGAAAGLRLVDLVLPQTVASGDPFGPLLNAYASGKIVVFDVETTGLSVGGDEVVELAAVRLEGGKPAGGFHSYIRNTVPVGAAKDIHGLSDDFLAENGRPAADVFREFLLFADGGLLVGHNVGYDIKMVSANARRAGVDVPRLNWADTMVLAERFVEARNYRLQTLAEELGLHVERAHRAGSDVETTVELLRALIPKVEARTMERRALAAAHVKGFAALARQVEGWKGAMGSLRPAELLEKVLEESGLAKYYADEPRRLGHLERLVRIFRERDESGVHPETALRGLIEFTSLARNVDYLSSNDNLVMVITVHQAKGLEFDTVFIAGAVEDEMPHFYNKSGERLEEERRLFYVAVTRARERLFISGHAQNRRGYRRELSQFISAIDRRHLRFE